MENYYNSHKYYTEAEKNSDDYLMGHIDQAISELVVEKTHLKTAYNYYNGVMDAEEFQYLEETYGIGNPTSLEFIPLVRKHIDALIGEHLGNKLKPKITCKDQRTIGMIDKLKKKEIDRVELNTLKNQFQANVDHLIELKENPHALPPMDTASEDNIKKKKEDVAKSFISEFELSAQFVVENLKQNKSFDLTEKRRTLIADLLIAGECHYKTEIVHEGQAPKIVIVNPRDFFFEPNPNSPYTKASPRIVNRKWMTRDQILSRYGHLFEDQTEDINKLFSNLEYMNYANSNNYMYVTAPDAIGIQAGVGVAVTGYGDNDRDYRWNLIPVYEVEWVTTNKIKENGKTIFRQDRYKGTRIGTDIYAEMGLDETAIRSIDSPYECFNSFNGVCYSNRNGKPYSLVLATKQIQDKYNLLFFHRDNLIANSGVKGGYVDVANIPDFLGNSPEERALKYTAYKKQGNAFINSAQEGAGTNNTIYSGFDESLSGQALQAIQLAIQQTEDICSGITGVFRERLGNIEQRDAVSNIEVGIKTSAVITKQYFHIMDNLTTELLIDAINMCKISYKDGMIGSILLGNNKQKTFTINPKYFSFTDYDIHIGDSSEILQEIQEIKATSMELIKAGMADVDLVIDIMTTESLSDMRDKVQEAVGKKTEENSQMGQMQQQLQQLQQQLMQVNQQAEQLQKENEALKQADKDLEKLKSDRDYEVKKNVADSNADFNTGKLDLDEKRVELEKLQLTDDNKQNDEVQNS
jgi:hypothetical protein